MSLKLNMINSVLHGPNNGATFVVRFGQAEELSGVLTATLITGGRRHGSVGECPKWNPHRSLILWVGGMWPAMDGNGNATRIGGDVLRAMVTFMAR